MAIALLMGLIRLRSGEERNARAHIKAGISCLFVSPLARRPVHLLPETPPQAIPAVETRLIRNLLDRQIGIFQQLQRDPKPELEPELVDRPVEQPLEPLPEFERIDAHFQRQRGNRKRLRGVLLQDIRGLVNKRQIVAFDDFTFHGFDLIVVRDAAIVGYCLTNPILNLPAS